MTHWFPLGLFLGAKHSTLAEIELQYEGQAHRCIIEVLILWMKIENYRDKKMLQYALMQLDLFLSSNKSCKCILSMLYELTCDSVIIMYSTED